MQVNIAEARTNLPKLFSMIQYGQEKTVIFMQNGKPLIKLERCEEGEALTQKEALRRTSMKDGVRIGIAEGMLSYPDDIHAFDDEIADMFGV